MTITKVNEHTYTHHHGTLTLHADGWHLTSPYWEGKIEGHFLYTEDELDIALAEMKAGMINTDVRSYICTP